MNLYDQLDADGFLRGPGEWRLLPSSQNELVFSGTYRLLAEMEGFSRVEETYDLKLVIAKTELPDPSIIVFELGGKIPRNADHHVNPDGSLCLGAPLKLLTLARSRDGLAHFFKECVVPYLYKVTHLVQHNVIPDELEHETLGLVGQYEELFGVIGLEASYRALKSLSVSWRNANKLLCPCGCLERLGRCDFRVVLKQVWRSRLPRSTFRLEANRLYKEVLKQRAEKVAQQRQHRKALKKNFRLVQANEGMNSLSAKEEEHKGTDNHELKGSGTEVK
tara:strand:+ start:5370 stop:6200 length:831 start_codon:yes stop_codon:yes gene_type:complete